MQPPNPPQDPTTGYYPGQTPPPGYPPQNPNQYPPQQYQPNYPQIPPGYPPQHPKKKWNGWLVALGVIMILAVLGTISERNKTTVITTTDNTPNDIGNTQPSPPTPTPTPVPRTWQTTHTYTGNGDKQTETINVKDDWKIQWSCQANDAPLYVSIYNADTKDMTDWSAVSTTCKNTPTTGETVQHQGGNIYLSIISGIDWTITIQELK